jgi:hypothetical protein
MEILWQDELGETFFCFPFIETSLSKLSGGEGKFMGNIFTIFVKKS